MRTSHCHASVSECNHDCLFWTPIRLNQTCVSAVVSLTSTAGACANQRKSLHVQSDAVCVPGHFVVGNSSRHHCIMEQGLTFKHGTSLSVWRSLLEMGCKLRHIYIYTCVWIYIIIYHLVRLEITSCFHLDMRANVIRFTVIFGENTFQKGIPKPIKEDENKHMTDPSLLLLLLIITTVIIALIIHIPIEVFFFFKDFCKSCPKCLGKWSNLTCAYFFKWVETQPPTSYSGAGQADAVDMVVSVGQTQKKTGSADVFLPMLMGILRFSFKLYPEKKTWSANVAGFICYTRFLGQKKTEMKSGFLSWLFCL